MRAYDGKQRREPQRQWLHLFIIDLSHPSKNTSMAKPNPYLTLGVNKAATLPEIKSAFRKLSLRHHPDRGGDKEAFSRVASAYAVLSDGDARALFDATGRVRDGDEDGGGNSVSVDELKAFEGVRFLLSRGALVCVAGRERE